MDGGRVVGEWRCDLRWGMNDNDVGGHLRNVVVDGWFRGLWDGEDGNERRERDDDWEDGEEGREVVVGERCERYFKKVCWVDK